MYNFSSNEWKTLNTLQELDFPERGNFFGYLLFAQNNNLIVHFLPEIVTPNDFYSVQSAEPFKNSFAKYNSNENLWIPMEVKLPPYEFNNYFYCTSTLLINLRFQQNFLYVGVFNFGNVLSLRDICFLKLFESLTVSCRTSPNENIIENIFVMLPNLLKRHYFGPEWKK